MPRRSEGTSRPSGARASVALCVLSGSQLLVVVDATIVNVALGPIRDGLGFTTASLHWVVSAYTLSFGALLLIGGSAADRFGHRRMFLLGATAFGAGSLIGGAAGNPLVLVGARTLQGAGAALMAPAAMALVLDVFAPGHGRRRALGIWAAVTAAGTALGSVLGGLLTEATSWRWVLWVNVPVVLVVVVVGLTALPSNRGTRTSPIDFLGAITVTCGVTLLAYGLAGSPVHGWVARTLPVLGGATAFLVAFVVLQSTRRAPLVPARILRRNVVVADVVGLILGCAMYTMFFVVSLFLSSVQGKDPLDVGLAFVPMTAATAVAARISARLSGRAGPHVLAGAGVALVATGLLMLADLDPASSYVGNLMPSLVVAGTGLGITFVPLTEAALSGASRADSGIASALFNAGQNIGGALGLALLSSLGAGHGSGTTAAGGWSAALLVAATLTGVGALLAVTCIRAAPHRASAA